jgi:ABC-2 type transport system ATP-binding protein
LEWGVTTLIEAEGLRKSYGDSLAVEDISLRVKSGEIHALVGPDGAGKTTVMRLLCGALKLDAGRVWLAGIDLLENPEEARAEIGYLPQKFSLYGELTVGENLQFFAGIRGLNSVDWEQRSQEILEFVELYEFIDRRADQLSGGMKQKLGLAAALVHQPQILLLDEPTGGVDVVTRQAFWKLLIQLVKSGVAVLLTTPYMDEASRCSKVGFMMEGRLMLVGSPQALTCSLDGQILELIGSPRRTLEQIAKEDPSVLDVQVFGDRLHLHVPAKKSKAITRRLKKAIKRRRGELEDIGLVPASLEDVFIHLLTKEEESK